MTTSKRISLYQIIYFSLGFLFILNGLSSALRYTEINELFTPSKVIFAIYPKSLKKSLLVNRENFKLPKNAPVYLAYPHIHYDIFIHSLHPQKIIYLKKEQQFAHDYVLASYEQLSLFRQNHYQVDSQIKLDNFPIIYLLKKDSMPK